MKTEIQRRAINLEDTLFEEVWQLYTSSFPISERRDEDEQKKLITSTANYHCEALFCNDSLLGFLFWWEFPKLRFIEHFATFPRFRNQGLGKQALQNFMEENSTPIILETEPPLDEITKRRINFYKRLGFHINKIEYLQPPYRKGEKAIKLLLSSFPNRLTDEDFVYFQTQCLPQIYPLLSVIS